MLEHGYETMSYVIVQFKKTDIMLEDKKLKSFIPTVEPEKAKNFYTKVLGLKLLSEDQYGMEFYSEGSLLRINVVNKLTPHPFTVLGWDVDDLPAMIISLVKAGSISTNTPVKLLVYHD